MILVAGGLAWAGLRYQRARQGLVSLSVRDVPLAAVLQSLERQSGRRIVAATNLTSRISLEAGPLPWTEMLDRVAEQAGATWSQWHAVHTRRQELDRLVDTIKNRRDLAGIDWTNLAPMELNVMAEAMPGLPGLPPGARGQMIVRTLDGPPPGDLPPGAHTVDIDTRVGGPGSDAEIAEAVRKQLQEAGHSGGNVRVVRRQLGSGSNEVAVTAGAGAGAVAVGGSSGPRPSVRVITRTADANGRMTEEVWVPERIVAERSVAEKLGDNLPRVPNRVAADAVARASGGQATTLVVFSGGAGGALPAGLLRAVTSGRVGGASGGSPPGPGEVDPANLENFARRDKAERYMKLTPEQRAERQRLLKPAGSQP